MTAYQTTLSDQEWNLLVGFPQAVASAASAAETDSLRRTLVENEAGLEAIAEGREVGDSLVGQVATELVARVGGDPLLGEEPPMVVRPADPAAYVADCLGRAPQVSLLLTDKVDEGDAGAYRHWLVSIAERVVGASSSGGVLGFGGAQVTEAEQSFVDRLRVALND